MKMSRVVLAAALLVSTPSITLMAIAQDRARAQAAPSSPSASQAKTADQTPRHRLRHRRHPPELATCRWTSP